MVKRLDPVFSNVEIIKETKNKSQRGNDTGEEKLFFNSNLFRSTGVSKWDGRPSWHLSLKRNRALELDYFEMLSGFIPSKKVNWENGRHGGVWPVVYEKWMKRPFFKASDIPENEFPFNFLPELRIFF